MRPAWQLATNNLAGRRTRSLLLILAVALATALSVAVSASMDTLVQSLRQTVGQLVGLVDAKVQSRYGRQRMPDGVSLRLARTDKRAPISAEGIDPAAQQEAHPMKLLEGRFIEADDEIVLDQQTRDLLGAKAGETIEVDRIGEPVLMKLVGVVERPKLSILQSPKAYVTVAASQRLARLPGQIDEIDIKLRPGVSGEDFPVTHADDLPRTLMIKTPASVTTGATKGVEGVRLLVLFIMVLVFLSAGFIILTSLTTAVTERLRELGMLRCIGASRGQIAAAQLITGGLLAGAGAVLGVPLGLGFAYYLYARHADTLQAGFAPSMSGLVYAVAAAVFSGLLGAIYPALLAARTRPLQAVGIRAKPPRTRLVLACLFIGLACVLAQPVIARLPLSKQSDFWLTIALGIPAVFVGYFLLSVPVLVLAGKFATPALAKILRLPRTLLAQSVLTTPFRQGFTGGALMVSLAMLVGVWTLGRSAMSGWFDNLRMPEAFVQSVPFALTPEQWDTLGHLDVVADVCPTTMFPIGVRGAAFGVEGFTPPKTFFVAFEPESFFRMTQVKWYQGDQATAIRRLKEGGAVLVSREYLVAHKLGLGGRIAVDTPRQGPVEFEIVGVIGAAGLDVAVQFFQINNVYAERAISTLFGSRADALKYFGTDAINLALVDIKDGVSDEVFLKTVLDAMKSPLVVAGSSRMIMERAHKGSESFMTLASTVAIASLIIACLGVGNLILANLTARRFEYGVLRAIGAPRGMLGRLVAGETILVALVGCVVGTALGIQLALLGQHFHKTMMGLVYDVRVPIGVTAWGWAAVVAAALLAALPAIVRLVRQHPRVLLAAEADA